LVDDIKPGGLGFQWKFVFQILGALLLIAFDMRIKFIDPPWLATLVTILWVVGITNAFNLIDIMDGLSSSQAFVASLGFLFIAVPTEDIHVNFTAAAVAGACLGFLPYNMSARFKIFMGDAGSLLLGFLMAALSLGMTYTKVNDIGVFSPLLILGLPLYDTFFVSILRIQQGKSPFLGSKDHLALKLAALGIARRNVVGIMAAAAAVCSLTAYMVSWSPFFVALFVIGGLAVVGMYFVVRLQKVRVP